MQHYYNWSAQVTSDDECADRKRLSCGPAKVSCDGVELHNVYDCITGPDGWARIVDVTQVVDGIFPTSIVFGNVQVEKVT